MTRTNYYCASLHCRRTTVHLCVKMEAHKYLYCVECGRRLDVIAQPPLNGSANGSANGHTHGSLNGRIRTGSKSSS